MRIKIIDYRLGFSNGIKQRKEIKSVKMVEIGNLQINHWIIKLFTRQMSEAC